eukprot:gene9730-10723_t
MADCQGQAGFDVRGYTALIGLAEYFRAADPPKTREYIHCLQACLNIGLPALLDAKNQANFAKNILRSALERSSRSKSILWHYRLIFNLAEIHAQDKEFSVAIELLSTIGELTARKNGHNYARLLFLMSKLMNFKAFEKFIQETDASVASFKERLPNQERRIHVFWNLLKCYYFLWNGQAKSAKSPLKVLQQSIHGLSTSTTEESNDPESLQWLSYDELCILAYLVTVAHCMHIGCLDKAMRYTDKALAQIEAVRGILNTIFIHSDISAVMWLAAGESNMLLTTFQLSLMEHAIMCKIINGKGAAAIQDGLYGMSMNLMNEAVHHFQKALQLSRQQSEVYNLAALNLAIIFARGGEPMKRQLHGIFHNLNNDTVTRSHSLQAGYFYVRGLASFFDANFNDARKYLRETLRLGNAEDLNRITACSLVLLGNVVVASGNPQEALNMVIPAMQLATKVSDVYLQLWSASLLKDIYHLLEDEAREVEGAQLHHLYTTQLLQDHFQAGQRPEHAMLKMKFSCLIDVRFISCRIWNSITGSDDMVAMKTVELRPPGRLRHERNFQKGKR